MGRFTINSLLVGEKKISLYLPHLLPDIQTIVRPESQTDPTFQTTRQYRRITAPNVRNQLLEISGYTDGELPTIRTILSTLNTLDYRPRKVVKSKPKKKLPQTDAIFHRLHIVNHLADTTPGYLRLSLDTKATIRLGPYSRGGYNRQQVAACDHDFAPEAELKLFGILLPASDDLWFFFTESAVTADFMVDRLETLWPEMRRRFHPHTLVLNMDNGPETQSHRTQLLKRLVEFARTHYVNLDLAYYPPYHSKYNAIERVWGVLENHWRGELLDSRQKVLDLAQDMTWNGHHPVVTFVATSYQTGVKLSKKAMQPYEQTICRMPGLERWFVWIPLLELGGAKYC